jgi:uncharacterized protein YndB with AHSA1/START domain
VLEAKPASRLRLGWREEGDAMESEVSFDLTPTPAGGTRLRVVHGPVVVRMDLVQPMGRRGAAPRRSIAGLRMAA